MVNSDSLLSRLLPGLLVAAALFGMWWLFVRDGGSQAVPREAPGVLDGPSSAIPYLLQSSQLGPEYDQKTAGSRPVTSSEMRAGQSPRGLDVVKAAWNNGARGSWVQAHGTITVTSEAELFDTSSAWGGVRQHRAAHDQALSRPRGDLGRRRCRRGRGSSPGARSRT